jgi:hypothetical protein
MEGKRDPTMQQPNQQKRSRRVPWLRFLRNAAIVIGFVASVLGLVKVALELEATVEQRAEIHSKN